MAFTRETISNIHAAAHQVAIEAARKEEYAIAETYTVTYKQVVQSLVEIYEEYQSKVLD